MRLSNKFNKERFLSFFDTIRSLPKFVWVFLIVVFLLGFLIRGGGGNYIQFYDDETRKIVAERYAPEIAYFKFQFGE